MKKIPLFFLSCSAFLFACNPASPDTDPEQPDAGDDAKEVESSGEKSGTSVHNVSPGEAAALLAENPEAVVLDVRTPEEFAAGHVEGAVNVDFRNDSFAEELAKLDPEKPYLMHCRSGARSKEALPVFERLNFSEIYHLDTGFQGWEGAGLPVEK